MNYDTLVAHASQVANQLALPEAKKVVFAGIEMLRYDIPAGMLLVAHCHGHDHLSILASGEVELWSNQTGLMELVGPCEVGIVAGEKHAVQAKTDAVWYCLDAEDH